MRERQPDKRGNKAIKRGRIAAVGAAKFKKRSERLFAMVVFPTRGQIEKLFRSFLKIVTKQTVEQPLPGQKMHDRRL